MKQTGSIDRHEIWDPLDVHDSIRPYLWAVLAVVICFLHGPAFVASLRPGPTQGVDFFQEWASAKNWLNGRAIYTDLAQTAELYLGFKSPPGEDLLFTTNSHPPTSILLAIPFGLLAYPTATLVWNVVSLMALAVSLWLIGRGLNLKPKPWFVFPATAVLLLCNPLRQQINQGQLNLVLLFLLTAVWAADRSQRPRTAGVLLGMATAIKLFPGFFFLYFLLRRQWTTVISGTLAFAAATVLTFAILGGGAYQAYVRDVLPKTPYYTNSWTNASIAGFWTKWFDVGGGSPMRLPHLPRRLPPLLHAREVARAGLLVSCGIVLLLWGQEVVRVRTRREADLACGLTFVTMLLVSPLTWDHYFVLLALPLIQLWLAVSSRRRERSLLLLLVACLWINPFVFWKLFIPETQPSGAAVFFSLVAVSIQCVALTGLFGLSLLTRTTTRED